MRLLLLSLLTLAGALAADDLTGHCDKQLHEMKDKAAAVKPAASKTK